MTDYISMDIAIRNVCNSFTHTCSIESCGFGCQEANALLQIPAADVVTVVRCKECYYYYLGGLCSMLPSDPQMPPDGFCFYGRRKEDNDA